MNKLALFLLAGTLLTGCYYDNEEELYPQTTTATTATTATTSTTTGTVVTYTSDIQPLIAANCAVPGCHVAGATFPDLSSYTGLKNNITAVKTRAIDQQTMPAAGPMSSADIAKLQSWIDAGALNN
ncbi:MAG: hypothetical protein V4651_10165 [Bacteroidota bacterium]